MKSGYALRDRKKLRAKVRLEKRIQSPGNIPGPACGPGVVHQKAGQHGPIVVQEKTRNRGARRLLITFPPDPTLARKIMQYDRQRLHRIKRLARELIELVGFDEADVDHSFAQPIQIPQRRMEDQLRFVLASSLWRSYLRYS